MGLSTGGMSLIWIEHNPTRRQLLVFGACWLLFVGAAGFVLQDRGASGMAVGLAWGLAVAVPLLGLLIPEILRWAYVGLSYLTFPIGLVVSHLVLGVVYFLVLTPLGLVMRALGHDPLGRHFDATAASHWVPREAPADPKRYFRQF